MPATISHVLSATTPDDPAFEIRPSHWNSVHNITLNAVGSEISNAFGNGGGVTFGYDGTNVTAAAGTAAPSPVNFSAGTTSGNLGSVVFSNSNGVSFGLSGSTITGTVATNYQSQGAYLTTARASNDAVGLNTANTNVTWTVNSSGISINAAGYAGTGTSMTNATATLNSNGLQLSVAAPTALTSWTVSDAATSATVGRLAFTQANGITMTLSTSNNGNHTVFASYTVPTITSWTVSDSATSATVGRLAFTASNGITMTLSTSNNGNHTVFASHNGLTSQSNQALSASNGSFTFQTAAFSNANNVTFGTSAGSIVTASVAAPVTYIGGISNSQTMYTSGTVIISEGGGAVTVASAAAQHFNISVPQTSSIVGTSGVSVSTNGSTISVFPKALSVWEPVPLITGTGTSSHAPASFWFSNMILDWPVAVSYVNVLKSLNVSAPGMSSQNSSATNKFSYSHGLTLFTRQDFAGNSSNMSQWTTASFGMTGTLSQSSSSASVALSWVTNSTGGTTSFSTTSASNNWTNFFTGLQMFRIPLVTTLTPGEYFVGQAHSSTTATVGSNFTLLSVSNFHIVEQSITLATITSSGSLAFSAAEGMGIGVASAVTTNNTMALSVISAGTQNWWYMNFSNT